MLKNELRDILAENQTITGETSWLDSLTLRQEENTLKVVFPHMYFAAWFSQHKRAAFEEAVNRHFNEQQASPAPQIVYERTSASARDVATVMPASRSSLSYSAESEGPQDDPFAGFIFNGKNTFPLATAKEISGNTNTTAYNPFLVCGRSGTGKSLLLQSMATTLARTTDAARMVCTNPARFFSEDTAWAKSPELFWQRYDVLMLDDIQDMSSHSGWQNKLVACMDACPGRQENTSSPERQQVVPVTGTTAFHSNRKRRASPRMIFACSGQTQTLRALDERLRSRLESGLVVELMEPDLDVRLRYLQLMCKERRLPLTREQLLFLAQRCSQFRLLQGLILKVGAYCAVKGLNLTQTDLENIVRTGVAEKMPGCREILAEVAKGLNLKPDDVLGGKRRPDLVLARQIAMYVCRQKLGLSYPELGRAFGGRDHSTVIHAIKKINKLLVSDKRVQKLVTEFEMKTP
ncbi:MAG: helix-turn-helix domain-containing protein [Desulfovibrio sp.]|uniref:helix-turn-helix domain-containing protein n=1 Tax=Desulfovibrio sp. TaxID=885 RepID=UPI0039E661A0